MRGVLTSNIMARTTLNLDPLVLDELKKRAHREGKAMGDIASRLLAQALRETPPAPPEPFKWISKKMGAIIPMDDWAVVKDFLDDELNEPYRREFER